MSFLYIEQKEDSPQKVEQLQGVDSKLYIKAEEFNKTVAAINNLDNRVSETSNKLVTDAGFLITGTNFRLNAGNRWEISGGLKTNVAAINKSITLSSTGMRRQCIVQLDANNDFYFKYGQPHAVSPPKPVKDPGTVELTDFTVTDSEVGTPTNPITGNQYVTKLSLRDAFVGYTGQNVFLPAPLDYYGYRLIAGGLVSVAGINSAVGLVDGTIGAMHPITNATGAPVLLVDSAYFITGNLRLSHGKVAVMRYEGQGVFRLVFTSQNISTLDQVLDNSQNLTSRKIVQDIPNGIGYGFQTNLSIKAGFIYGQMLNGPISLWNNIASFETGVGGKIRTNRKMYYDREVDTPVPTDFSGREIPDAQWVQNKLNDKANVDGTNAHGFWPITSYSADRLGGYYFQDENVQDFAQIFIKKFNGEIAQITKDQAKEAMSINSKLSKSGDSQVQFNRVSGLLNLYIGTAESGLGQNNNDSVIYSYNGDLRFFATSQEKMVVHSNGATVSGGITLLKSNPSNASVYITNQADMDLILDVTPPSATQKAMILKTATPNAPLIIGQGSNGSLGVDIFPTEKLEINGNFKLNGSIMLGQFTTATQPAYEKGKMYFNVTFNNIFIGGETGWRRILDVTST